MPTELMKVYHYTSRGFGNKGWTTRYLTNDHMLVEEGISVKGLELGNQLIAGELCPKLGEDARKPAVYFFHKPRPPEWTENPEHIHIWNFLISRQVAQIPYVGYRIDSCGDTTVELIEAEIDPKSAFVFNYSPIWRYQRGPKTQENSARRAGKEYWDSRVALADYKGNYALPEVISFEPVTRDRVRLVETMPLREVMVLNPEIISSVDEFMKGFRRNRCNYTGLD